MKNCARKTDKRKASLPLRLKGVHIIPVLATVALLSCAAMVLVSASKRVSPSFNANAGATTRPELSPISVAGAVSSQGNRSKSEIEVELVTLKAWGFEPGVITRPKGRFVLAINNQSQLGEVLTFSLVEERGNKLKDVKLDYRASHRWNSVFDLNPGRYQLTVTEHPEWVCELNISGS